MGNARPKRKTVSRSVSTSGSTSPQPTQQSPGLPQPTAVLASPLPIEDGSRLGQDGIVTRQRTRRAETEYGQTQGGRVKRSKTDQADEKEGVSMDGVESADDDTVDTGTEDGQSSNGNSRKSSTRSTPRPAASGELTEDDDDESPMNTADNTDDEGEEGEGSTERSSSCSTPSEVTGSPVEVGSLAKRPKRVSKPVDRYIVEDIKKPKLKLNKNGPYAIYRYISGWREKFQVERIVARRVCFEIFTDVDKRVYYKFHTSTVKEYLQQDGGQATYEEDWRAGKAGNRHFVGQIQFRVLEVGEGARIMFDRKKENPSWGHTSRWCTKKQLVNCDALLTSFEELYVQDDEEWRKEQEAKEPTAKEYKEKLNRIIEYAAEKLKAQRPKLGENIPITKMYTLNQMKNKLKKEEQKTQAAVEYFGDAAQERVYHQTHGAEVDAWIAAHEKEMFEKWLKAERADGRMSRYVKLPTDKKKAYYAENYHPFFMKKATEEHTRRMVVVRDRNQKETDKLQKKRAEMERKKMEREKANE